MATTIDNVPDKLPILRRNETVSELLVRQVDGKRILQLSVSSEKAVDRWFGTEILSHAPGAVRLQRIKNGAVPFLFNHDPDDPIGMASDGWLKDGRLYVEGPLFETERAFEVEKMINGGLRNVSPGYRIHAMEKTKDQEDTFTARDWEPLEISIATIPADETVGIGRSEQMYEVRMITHSASPADKGGSPMEGTEKTATAAEQGAEKGSTEERKGPETYLSGAEQKRSAAVAQSAADVEKSRIRAIDYFAKANNIDDGIRKLWVDQGASLEEVGRDILNIQEQRCKSNPQPVSKLGLMPHETKRFSLTRAIRAVADGDWSLAGFEAECSRSIQQKLNQVPKKNSFYVPFEVLERPVEAKRDLTAASAGAGGYLVSTDNVGFIELLRNRSVAFRMGVRRLSGLQGNVTIPRQSAAATAFWLATESTGITESQQTFVQVALTPKNVGAYTEISRQLLLQSSPGAEGIVTDDLAKTVAIAADLGVLNGSGASGQPTGIINTAGIGSVTGTTFDYADILEFQSDVAAANVQPASGGYVTTPAVAVLAMTRVKFTSTASPLWEGNVWDGTMAGFPAMSSNQMPSGNMLFGDWQEAVVGEWGVLEVEVNPFANFPAGIVGIRAIYSMDVGVRLPAAFSLMTSAT